jgi:flagellar protein FliO/FliZ
LYLGGEKLKASLCISKNRLKFVSRFFLAVVFIASGLFLSAPAPLLAQDTSVNIADSTDAAVPRDPRAAEQTMILGEAVPPGAPAQGPASFFVVLRMILVLILAAAAIYGVVWFVKRASRRSDPKDPNLHVLSSVHLGLNRYVHIVSVGSQAWLLGAADGGVTLITEIQDKDIINAMLLEDSKKSVVSGAGGFIDFKSMLRRFGVGQDGNVPGPDNIKKRRERLKGL